MKYMRVEPYTVGSVVHVVKRGARGMEIVRDESDRFSFVRNLYLLNDQYKDANQHREFPSSGLFERPDHWPERKPLVSILAWTLMPNHFHLLLQETQEGGMSKFMQRLGCSMSVRFNHKHKEQGSIFQGSFKSRTVQDDAYLQYVLAYIVVKNVFELHPQGFKGAAASFDKSWEWAKSNTFSSFLTHSLGKESPIINMSAAEDLGLIGGNFKKTARDMLEAYVERQVEEDIDKLLVE